MYGLIRAMGTQSGKHKLQIEQPLYSRIINKILQIRSPLEAHTITRQTCQIGWKCLKVNFLQTSYNLNINSINNTVTGRTFLLFPGVPVKCETKQKRNGTKQIETKRNKSKRNETDRKKRNKSKRNETNKNETKQMIWQVIVHKNGYFLVFSNTRNSFFLTVGIHFLILENEFLILKIRTIF